MLETIVEDIFWKLALKGRDRKGGGVKTKLGQPVLQAFVTKSGFQDQRAEASEGKRPLK